MKDTQAVGTTPAVADSVPAISGGLTVDSTMSMGSIADYCSSDARDTRKVSESFNRVNADGHNG